MKQRILLTYLLLESCCLFSFAQTSPFIKVYAYSQASPNNIKPQTTTAENGNQITIAHGGKVNYYFYIEYKRQEKFTITNLWINGKPYRLKADSIRQTPIEMSAGNGEIGNNSRKIILVPATSNKVLLLSPGSFLKINPSSWLKKMLVKADLVIAYRWKGKIWYYPVPKIKMLEVVAGV